MKKWLAPLSLLALATAISVPAKAEVLIAPTRVVLENGQRSAELVIVNKGDEEAAFRISLENRRMDIDGSMETVETPLSGELFAIDHLRYSPRRVMLEPGGRQTIRVSLKGGAMEKGEYRSHLRLMSAPASAGRTLQSAGTHGSDGISIQLVAIRSLTIPVIARVGDLGAQISLDSAALETISHTDGEMVLEAHITRSGDKSTYGDIELYTAGQDEPVYFARGIAVYTPNTKRIVKLPLPSALSEQLKGQSVRIVYRSSDATNPEIYSEFTRIMN